VARAPYLAVVRRGNTKVYEFLKEPFEAQGLVEVVWERRIADRRREGRRRGVAETWDTLGFVLVRQGSESH
jgi:hypothetical protein